MKSIIVYSALFLNFLCSPINNNILEIDLQRKFDGFSNSDTFQVHCSINIFQNFERSERRERVLENCKRLLVTRLAEFKIAYDYNVKTLKFQIQNNGGQSLKSAGFAVIKDAQKIHHLNQLSIDWDNNKINQLMDHYKNYLPGQISYEWTENENENFIYTIKKSSLMQEIKNTPLPFGVEFQNSY